MYVGQSSTKYVDGYSDDLSMDEYFEWQKKVISECIRVSKTWVFYNVQMLTGNKLALMKLLGHFAENVKEIIVWDKVYAEPAMKEGVLNSQFEFVIVFSGKLEAMTRQFKECNFKRGTLPNILKLPNRGKSNNSSNSAVFSEKFTSHFIGNFTKVGDIVYDPFLGTGTTAVVCKKMGRGCLGSEINPAYQSIIEQRLKFTNKPDAEYF